MTCLSLSPDVCSAEETVGARDSPFPFLQSEAVTLFLDDFFCVVVVESHLCCLLSHSAVEV